MIRDRIYPAVADQVSRTWGRMRAELSPVSPVQVTPEVPEPDDMPEYDLPPYEPTHQVPIVSVGTQKPLHAMIVVPTEGGDRRGNHAAAGERSINVRDTLQDDDDARELADA